MVRRIGVILVNEVSSICFPRRGGLRNEKNTTDNDDDTCYPRSQHSMERGERSRQIEDTPMRSSMTCDPERLVPFDVPSGFRVVAIGY